MSIKSVLLSTAGALSLGLIGGVAGVAWYASNKINPPRLRTYFDEYTFTPWELGIPYEEITLISTDGLKLRAWWLPRPSTNRVIVGAHGHTGGKHDLLGIGSGLWRAGYNVFLFDFRGRGNSDIAPSNLAHREVDDMRTAVNYIFERVPNAKLGAIGFSMGAAVTLLVGATDPRIEVIVADSPFATATDVISNGMQSLLHISPPALLTATDLVIAARYGYRISKIRPIDAVSHVAPRPLLIIHGTSDSLIPVNHAHDIFKAAHEPKELWLAQGAEHCGAYFIDRELYVNRVRSFFDQYLGSIADEE